MLIDLRAALPALAPKATAWVESQHIHIAQVGRALDDDERTLAEGVGVRYPDRIRIAEVPDLPVPDDPDLRQAAKMAGILGPGTAGLTLGYGIYVRRGHGSIKLYSHEFRHVHQYERAGSIAAFLSVYLQQVVEFGYYNAPLEVDARVHEKPRQP